MRKRILYISSIIILSLFLGFSAATSVKAVEDFSGYWSGTWRNNQGTASGTNSHQLTQNGSSVSGTHSTTGGSCPPNNAPTSGAVNGNILTAETNYSCGGNNILIQYRWALKSNNYIGSWTAYQDGSFYSSGTSTGTRSANFINATAGAGGTIIPKGKISVKAGSDKTFTITPNEGFKILDVKVDGVSVGAKSSYTFNNISANHTIVASFETAPAAKGSAVPTSVAPLLLNGGQD